MKKEQAPSTALEVNMPKANPSIPKGVKEQRKRGDKRSETLYQEWLKKFGNKLRAERQCPIVMEVKPEKKSPKKALTIAGAVIGGVLAVGGIAYGLRSCEPSQTMISENITTSTTIPGTPNPTLENAPVLVAESNAVLEKITAPEQRFGDPSDPWSSLASSWKIVENGYAAVLLTPPDGKVSRFNLNGGVAEAWFEVKDASGNIIPIVVLAGPQQKQLDARGATIRVSNNPAKLYQEIKPKLIAREKIEQPGVKILEACISPDLSASGWVNTKNLGTPAEIVKRFARDPYSANINNWTFGLEGGNLAVLKAPADGSVATIKLDGNAVAEGYFDSPNGRAYPAMSFVIDSSQGFAVGRGFSIRDFVSKEGLDQLARQHLERESREQPGIVTIIFGKCQEPLKVTVPTPEVVIQCAWPNTEDGAGHTFGMDDYSQNGSNWERLLDGRGWHMKEDGKEHEINFCHYIGQGYRMVVVKRKDPPQAVITIGEKPEKLLGVTIWGEQGEEAANSLFQKYFKSNPFDTVPPLAVGFTPNPPLPPPINHWNINIPSPEQ